MKLLIFAISWSFLVDGQTVPFSDVAAKVIENLYETFSGVDDNIIRTNPITDIGHEYDFVIVGSGSAGSVLANRLSEVAQWKVLLLEAGKPENGFTSVPMFASLLQWTDYNWKYLTERQDNICRAMTDQRCSWPRGKALGGCSVINFMIYTRGHRLDYDRWEAAGNPGWGYDDVMPYFYKSENVHLHEYDEEYHNKEGYLSTSHVYKSEITDAFLDAAREIGEPVLDYNGKEQKGFGYIQATVLKGRRHSVAKAFLQPVTSRKNLHILTGARVTKLVIDPTTMRANGVEYMRKGRRYTANARKEVILSAGALNTPQLLMLSGIGPREHLQDLGIPVVADLPVGRNLQDHPFYSGLVFTINTTVENPQQLLDPKLIMDWYQTGVGPLSSLGGIEAVGFIKTNASKDSEDYPDIELLFVGIGAMPSDNGVFNRRFARISDYYYNAGFKHLEGIPTWTIFPILLHPKSRGYIKLQSKDPFQPPLLYGNYFTDPAGDDKATFIEAFRYIVRLSETPAFQKYGSQLTMIPIPGCEDEEYWSCALEHFTSTLYHQLGTCKMGPESDREAVVDHELRVHGFKGLRVVDASVIPFAPSAHTNAPTIMIGEKASDLIKRFWLGL